MRRSQAPHRKLQQVFVLPQLTHPVNHVSEQSSRSQEPGQLPSSNVAALNAQGVPKVSYSSSGNRPMGFLEGNAAHETP
jgi:hypothetical protein